MPCYEPAVDCLKGRAILVTGAGDGLGRAAAIAYARHGAEVILLGKTVAKLEAVYDDIVRMGAPQPAVYPMDLLGATLRDYHELAANMEHQIGHLEGILHNAATLELLTPLEFHALDAWDRALRTNLTAPFLLTQACLPLLRSAESSAVIFTSDACAVAPKGYWGAYGVSKAAVHNLALMWAQELSDTSVRINVLDPGPARTEMRSRTHPGAPLSSWPLPEALMPAYLLCMDPASPSPRGQLILADDWVATATQDGGCTV